MIEIAVIILAVAVLAASVFLISVLVELKKTTRRLNGFIDSLDRDLLPAVTELRYALEDIRTTTKRARDLSEALHDVADNVRSVSDVVSGVRRETNATLAGLKAGLKTGLGVFLKNLIGAGPGGSSKEG